VSAALVLGGVDVRGPHLFTIYPHGSTDSLPFATMGSGSLNAMAVFEDEYRDDLPRGEAVALVAKAIR
jgi:20S proteasome subunit beta 2